MKTMRVHLEREVDLSLMGAFASALPSDIQVTHGTPAADDTEILVVGFPTEEMLAVLPQLHSVVVPFAGLVPSARTVLLTRPDLKVYNLHHNAAATAEKAIELMLAVAKKTVANDTLMRKENWSPRFEASEAVQLEGKTALVIGYGEIGTRVARACAGLGMDVVAVKRTVTRPSDGDVALYNFKALPALWPTANVVLICAPLTPETDNLVDRTALASLQPGSIIVNVGRGKIIEEEALYEALRCGHLHGAGLDVWWMYPRDGEKSEPSRFPFKDLNNVVMSPHIGGSVQDTEPRRMAALVELLLKIHRSDELLQPIDVVRGY